MNLRIKSEENKSLLLCYPEIVKNQHHLGGKIVIEKLLLELIILVAKITYYVIQLAWLLKFSMIYQTVINN